MIKVFSLENGIKTIVKSFDSVKSCSIGIFVKAGSAYETNLENGISHFIEHTSFKGTIKRNAFQISWDSEALGVVLNAGTTKEYTYYYVKTISEHTEKAFEILADLFNNSIYPETELDKERGVVIEEINMYQDTPDDVCTTELSRAFFGDKPGYGLPILGTKENIQAFIKQDILSYREKYYTTDNIVISFAGDITEDAARNLSEKYFGALPKTKGKKIDVDVKALYGNSKKVKDIEQAHLALAFDAVSYTDEKFDYYDITTSALGGGMSSRLFRKIREELGLCYNIYSYFSPYSKCGAMCVYAGLNNEKLQSAYDAISEELRLFKKQGITEEEFSLIREQIKSSVVFAQESTAYQMTLYGKRMLLFNEVYDFDKKLEKLNKITLEEVNDFIFNCLNFDAFATSVVAKEPIINL